MIVFCTTCKNRTQHLELTLPQNIEDNSTQDVKFVILDYNSQDHLKRFITKEYPDLLESGKVVLYNYKTLGPFKMAHAKNMAHRLGILEGADILVNLDADNLTGKDFDIYIKKEFEEPNIFLFAKMLKGQLPRGISGRIAVSTQAFILSGGYNEKYTDWSPDDKDFNIRLRRFGYHGIEIDNTFLRGVPHNDSMRFKEYPHARNSLTDENEFTSVNESDDTIANYGKIGCGMVWKNSTLYELDPIPTRIFGIGMHKTGTTSLHRAFQKLGLSSAHWPSAHWAKAVWLEMIATGRSLTLEQYYTVSDLPIPLLFQKLDKAYPGSKFILTIRSEDAWIKSIQKHWSYESNPFRSVWDSDPFTHKIHNELYGRKMFDEAVFLSVYRKHNETVRKYFKDRPKDLLVLDIDNQNDWKELCEFLNKPVPTTPYPKEHVSN